MTKQDNSSSSGKSDRSSHSRRRFVKSTASLGALGLFPTLASSKLLTKSNHEFESILERAVSPADASFNQLRESLVWQVAKPNRSPDHIINAHTAEDVIDAVSFARESRQKIIAKSGGHSICASFMRDEGILLNLSAMQQVSVDAEKKIVSVEPGVPGPLLLHKLQEHNLAFPVARGASVAVGGYILGGGLGFNPNTWGLAYSSIIAADVVLANGSLLTVSENKHSDIYWAVRGAGPGFFGIVTKYYLRAHDLPRTLMTSQYIHPLDAYEKVAAGLERLVPTSDHRLEFILLLTSNPDKEAAKNGGPKQVCVVNVVAYGDEEVGAQTLLDSVAKSSLADKPLKKSEFQTTTLAVLTGETGEAFPRGRMATEGVWSDSISPVIAVLCDRMKKAVTPITTVSLRFIGNKNLPGNACFSLIATTNILSVLTWQDEGDDTAINEWLAGTMVSLQPYSLGHYINNEDVVSFPERNRQSFDTASWERLRALRKQYDPGGVFHDYFGVT